MTTSALRRTTITALQRRWIEEGRKSRRERRRRRRRKRTRKRKRRRVHVLNILIARVCIIQIQILPNEGRIVVSFI